jgi:hypothetical protein
MKTEVYNWRVSRELKSELEREARLRKAPVSSILDAATREWLKRSSSEATDDERQRFLQSQASACFGAFGGPGSRRAETARKTVKERLRRRHAR